MRVHDDDRVERSQAPEQRAQQPLEGGVLPPLEVARKLEKDQQRPLVGTPGQLVIEAQLEERGARRRDRAVVVEVARTREAVLECVDELRVEEVGPRRCASPNTPSPR